MDKPLRIREFAALTRVTVRALHHYDRIGLLQPHRTGKGYRLYGKRELERLEQIVALRFIGVPLKEMGKLLKGSALEEALPRQRAVLEQKRRMLDEAIRAIEMAERSLEARRGVDTVILTNIIEVIAMQNDSSWTEKYYSSAAQTAIKEGQAAWTPELQAKAEQDWRELFRDIEAALDLNAASDKAQELGRRWKSLVGAFTRGNPEVAKGLNRMYADRPNWPQPAQQQMASFGNPRVWEFIQRVLNCKEVS